MSLGLVRGETDLLFCKVDWHSLSDHQRKQMLGEIDGYNANQLLNTSTDDLAAYFAEKYSLDVPVLHEERIAADQRETQIDVSQEFNRVIHDRSRPFYINGTLIEVEIPFSGDPGLFKVQPTTFTLNPPRAQIRNDRLLIAMQGTDLNPQSVRGNIDRSLSEIKTHLDCLRQTAEPFNASLATLARERIEARKAKLLKDRDLVANLGFPMKQREGAALTYAAPEVKRKIALTPPTASTAPFRPEPVLSDTEYENILTIMESMVHVMERSPGDFAHMKEETLRSHFLVQLNAQYEGQATGETFNYEGKTDILIKCNGRNIFIAECKFWAGAKKYHETIDQLLSYLSWRDTKAAVVVFNRNKNFSGVLAEISRTTPEHPNCKNLLRQRSESSWVYRFAHRDDPNREMTVTVMAFDIPTLEEPRVQAL